MSSAAVPQSQLPGPNKRVRSAPKSSFDHVIHPSPSRKNSISAGPSRRPSVKPSTQPSNFPHATDSEKADQSDLSPYNRWNNARIWASGSSLRNLVDATSVFYHYRRYHAERWSLTLDLGVDEDGEAIPPLRILVHLPLRDRAYALERWKGDNELGKKKGVVVHLHGGGFTMCRPEHEGHLCRVLCDTLSTIVISPDYLKAPQYPYPAALNQCHALLRWIADPDGLFAFLLAKGNPNMKTYLPRIDPRRIAVSGGSSGGNLAAALVVKDIRAKEPLPNGGRIVALGLMYAMLDVTIPFQTKLATVPDRSKVLPRWLTRLFLDGYLADLRIKDNFQELNHPFLSPGLCPADELKRFPRTVVVTAENDYLCREGEVFADRLVQEAGFRTISYGDNSMQPSSTSTSAANSENGSTTKSTTGFNLDGPFWLWRKTFKSVSHGFDIAPNFTKKAELLNGGARDEAWGMMVECFKSVL